MAPREVSARFTLRTSRVLPLFVQRLRAAGESVEALLRRFGLPPDIESRGEVQLPLETMYVFTEEVAAALGDSFLGLHVALSLPRGRDGLVEFVTRSASTLREAIQSIIRHYALINENIEVTLEERAGEALLQHRMPGHPLVSGRHINELFVVFVARTLSELSGQRLVPHRAWFAHPRTGDVSELAEALGTRKIEFGTGANGMLFEASVLELPVVSAEPSLHVLLKDYAHKAQAGLPRTGSFLEQVRETVRKAREHGPPSAERVARALHMSSHTLQRRMAEHGTALQALVEDVRQAQARLLLEADRFPARSRRR